jgi:hypothetical protein
MYVAASCVKELKERIYAERIENIHCVTGYKDNSVKGQLYLPL